MFFDQHFTLSGPDADLDRLDSLNSLNIGLIENTRLKTQKTRSYCLTGENDHIFIKM